MRWYRHRYLVDIEDPDLEGLDVRIILNEINADLDEADWSWHIFIPHRNLFTLDVRIREKDDAMMFRIRCPYKTRSMPGNMTK